MKKSILLILFSVAIFSFIGVTTAAATPTISIYPTSTTGLSQGDAFSVNVSVDPQDAGVSGAEFYLIYNASAVQINSITAGELLYGTQAPIEGKNEFDNVAGTASYAASRKGTTSVPSTVGTLAMISLTVTGDAVNALYELNLTSAGPNAWDPRTYLTDENSAEISPITITDGEFRVGPTVESPTCTVSVTNSTITPPQTTDITATFSEHVDYTLNIETNDGAVVYDWDGTRHTDRTVTWDGKNETTGIQVPDGTYTVNLTVTNTTTGLTGYNRTEAVIVSSVVSNQPPTAVITAPTASGTYHVGDEVSFHATDSSDPDGYIVSYNWTFGDGGEGTGVTTTHTYTTAGAKNVILKVTDNDSATNNTTVTINVLNTGDVPPTCTVSVTNSTITPPQTTDITATFSEHVDYTLNIETNDGAVVYDWDGTRHNDRTVTWDGKNETTGIQVPDGTYTVNLTVTNTTTGLTDYNRTEAVIVSSVVSNQPPTAFITAPTASGTYHVGDEVSFHATDSSDPDGYIVSYNWTFGDGNTSEVANTTHTYATANTYTVILTVTDNDSATNTTTVTIVVSNQPPTAFITAPTASGTYHVGDEVSFHATDSSDPDGYIVSYNWTFGDGNTSEVANTTHTYATANTYTVILTVTDNDSATNTTTVTINVLETEAVSVTLYTGWNLIAVPVNDSTANTAEELALKINGCKEVVKWDALTQMYITYSKISGDWIGTDFAITGGMGLFVNVEGNTTVGFTGGAWS
ncbi:MAG: hypothetical protein AEth_01486 [Candidatus Argoarchaeum ethanivorans]|uniref:PKD domain-containing protein n=1 Tax=Candidatus Argoarchaeum ethanivorans TaxID=2608793 RepID=A0A8B3S056_9EURY|nr:MAG: hypothetical protein AEth_01486 [Candidatus Argoarchaeum ethanivorans]